MSEDEDLEEQFCPCGGPPCQIHPCSLKRKVDWLVDWNEPLPERYYLDMSGTPKLKRTTIL